MGAKVAFLGARSTQGEGGRKRVSGPTTRQQKLGQEPVQHGLGSPEELAEDVRAQQWEKRPLAEVLVSGGAVGARILLSAFSARRTTAYMVALW